MPHDPVWTQLPPARCQHLTKPNGIRMVDAVNRAGVPLETVIILECEDVHPLALLYARSRADARGELKLVAEIPDTPLPTPTWLQVHRYAALATLFWLAVAAVSAALWSALT